MFVITAILLALHTPEGGIVYVSRDEITSLRPRGDNSMKFPDQAHCYITITDGKFVVVRENCETVRKQMEEMK